MKPILVVLAVPDSGSIASSTGLTLPLYQTLRTLGIPFEAKNSSDATVDVSLYSAAILTIGRTQNAYSRAWMDGSKAIPVIAYAPTPSTNSGSCVTGSTAETDVVADDLIATDEFGNPIHYQGGSGYTGAYAADEATLDPADTLVTNLIPGSEAGRSLHWKRDHATGNTTWYWHIESPILWVLNALNAAGVTPVVPYCLRVDIDDIEAMTTGHGAGATAIAAWLRARGAVAVCGLNAIEVTAADIKTILLANTDVFRFISHDHTGIPFRDDATYPTVAEKIDAHDARVAVLEAAGYPIDYAGPHGHWYNPSNTATPMGWDALAKIGVKVPRAIAEGGATPINVFGTNEVIWIYKEGANTYKLRSMKRFSAETVGTPLYSRKLIADVMTDASAAGDAAKYGRLVQNSVLMRQVILNDMPNIVFHGTNVEDDAGALSDNPALNFLNLMDSYVQRSGGWLKWAGMDDLAIMAAI